MGLDAVELVFEIERRYGIELRDSELSHAGTVADLSALVLSKLPRTQLPCATAGGFYAFRRLLCGHAGIPRDRIRPRTRLDELFPHADRWKWRAMRGHDARVPRLVVSERADRALLRACGVLVFAFVVAAGALFATLPAFLAAAGCVLLFVVGVVGVAGIITIMGRLAVEFPAGIETVGDVARRIAPQPAGHESPGARLAAGVAVYEEVRRMTAEQTCVPIERITPTTSFARDLGF